MIHELQQELVVMGLRALLILEEVLDTKALVVVVLGVVRQDVLARHIVVPESQLLGNAVRTPR